MTGDGTTTSVLFTGELLRQAERYLSEGLHPRVLTEGFELAKEHCLELLDTFRSTRQAWRHVDTIILLYSNTSTHIGCVILCVADVLFFCIA